MMTCRHATRLLSDRLDRPLSWLETLGLGVHLLGCEACRRFRRATGWLHRALVSSADDVELPSDARERIRVALEQAARDE
jgi:predicted anti-sigma-YlaC factor YlaD